MKNSDINMNELNTICFFGVGTLLLNAFNQACREIGRVPDYLVDNDQRKWGMLFFGITCISPEQLGKLDKGATIVITVKQFESIYQQLNTMEFSDIKLLCYAKGGDYISGLVQLNNVCFKDDESVDNLLQQIRGRWALVTGASRGIGYQIALGLARLGVNIVAHSRKLEHNQTILKVCSNAGAKVKSVSADLADEHETLGLLKQLPHIDILVNCAGISTPSSQEWSTDYIDFLTTLKINTIAPVMLCNALIPKMLSSGYGRVMNVTSSLQQSLTDIAYSCSKAGMNKFVHDLVPSLHDKDVKVSLLDPGWLNTDMGGEQAPAKVESVLPGGLLGIIMDDFDNGYMFNAQEFSGYRLEQAITKAKWLSELNSALNMGDLL